MFPFKTKFLPPVIEPPIPYQKNQKYGSHNCGVPYILNFYAIKNYRYFYLFTRASLKHNKKAWFIVAWKLIGNYYGSW